MRQALFYIYAGSFALWALNFATWLATNKIEDVIDQVNKEVNEVLGTNNETYADKLSDTVWLLISIYAAVIILIRLLFCRVLYYYMKELAEAKKEQVYHNFESSRSKEEGVDGMRV